MKLISIFLLLVFLSACTSVVKEKKTTEKQSIKKSVIIKVEKLPQESPVVEKPEPVSEQQDVLILLSSSAKSNQQIADKLIEQLGDHAIQITLSGQPAQDNAMIKDIKASPTVQIVAIGLKAVKAVQNMPEKQIVFAQVIIPRGLSSKNMKAVCALPSPEKLFKDWKALSPGLSKVAVVVGKDLDEYLGRAKKAARKNHIDLIVKKVRTDKEFIYKSKGLKSSIDGQWIIPDNRVLSGVALKEVMAFASRRGRQIVVFSPKLLSFGGFFYVVPDAAAIADGILLRLEDGRGKDVISGEDVLPVMSHTLGINKNIARQFNLNIPAQYRKFIDGE